MCCYPWGPVRYSNKSMPTPDPAINPKDGLKNCWVVVTRPSHQAINLSNSIESEGGHPIPFPVIEITAPSQTASAEHFIKNLDQYQLAIFISSNAVNRGLAMVNAQGHWPKALSVAAVGKATASALQAAGFESVLVPRERFDSEALIKLTALQDVAGQHIVIFRGEGGRAALGDGLRQRGAKVDYLECYRRVRPQIDPSILHKHWHNRQLDIITVTSAEGLRNLYDMVAPDDRQHLLATPLVVCHPRLVPVAHKLGWQAAILVAKNSDDDGLVEAIQAWRNESRQP